MDLKFGLSIIENSQDDKIRSKFQHFTFDPKIRVFVSIHKLLMKSVDYGVIQLLSPRQTF